VGGALGFTPLPWQYWPLVGAMLLSDVVITHIVKVWFVRRWGAWRRAVRRRGQQRPVI
jgi:Mg2+-importing ATPase